VQSPVNLWVDFSFGEGSRRKLLRDLIKNGKKTPLVSKLANILGKHMPAHPIFILINTRQAYTTRAGRGAP